MNTLKISVVTPSFNQGRYLEGTILSVLNQNYPNLEYIIMDGGSTDNSLEIIRKYEKHLTYWQSKPDGGQSAAINEGFRHATGEIYCWLNSDDQFTPGALDIVSKYFTTHPGCGWLVGVGILRSIRHKTKDIRVKPVKLDMKNIGTGITNIAQPSVFWLKKLWSQTGGVYENFHFAMDFDLWVQFSKISEGHIIDDVLSVASMYREQKSSANKVEYFVETGLSLFRNENIDLARNMLARPIKRVTELDNFLKIITRNPIYRKWRENRERKTRDKNHG